MRNNNRNRRQFKNMRQLCTHLSIAWPLSILLVFQPMTEEIIPPLHTNNYESADMSLIKSAAGFSTSDSDSTFSRIKENGIHKEKKKKN